MVKFFNKQRSFGFIIQDDNSKELYVHGSNVKEPIKTGDKVVYNIINFRGREQANNIEIVRNK